MKLFRTLFAIGFLSVAGFTVFPAPCAEPTNPPAAQKLTREDLREQLKGLSPAERDAKLKELRQKYITNSPERTLMTKRREELRNLTPEQREAKIREWRAGTNASVAKPMSAEERQARLDPIRARLKERVEELRQDKAKGTITPEDEKRLARMEEMLKRFAKESRPQPAPALRAPTPEKPPEEK